MVIIELTPREEQVVVLLAEGLSNEEIGRELYICNSTVKSYIKNVYAKLGARNRTHAVAIAYHNGILIPRKVVNGSLS